MIRPRLKNVPPVGSVPGRGAFLVVVATCQTLPVASGAMFRAVPQRVSVPALMGRMALAVVVLERGSRLASGGVPDWEARAFTRMNQTSNALSPVLWVPMQLGSLWGPLALGAAMWRFRGDRRGALGVLAAGVLAWQLAKVVKNRVGRGRPWSVMDEVLHRGGTPYEGLGYVSGHTAVGAAMVKSPQMSGDR